MAAKITAVRIDGSTILKVFVQFNGVGKVYEYNETKLTQHELRNMVSRNLAGHGLTRYMIKNGIMERNE